jgi:hypothetical protein
MCPGPLSGPGRAAVMQLCMSCPQRHVSRVTQVGRGGCMSDACCSTAGPAAGAHAVTPCSPRCLPNCTGAAAATGSSGTGRTEQQPHACPWRQPCGGSAAPAAGSPAGRAHLPGPGSSGGWGSSSRRHRSAKDGHGAESEWAWLRWHAAAVSAAPAPAAVSAATTTVVVLWLSP